jgi:type I restriction enzyme S subunit
LIGSVTLPLGWVWVRIDEVSNVGTGATPLKGNPKYYESGTISWVTSGLLNELFITKVEEKITELAVKETNAKVFPKHTLLVAMYGEGKTRGKVSELLVEAATNQACAALVFDGEASKLRPFVKLFLQKNYNDIRRLSSGGVQPNLNLGIIKATKVPVPPLNEQCRIVAKIEALKARSQRVKEELEAIAPLLDQFRQSVLTAAFRGDLTADWREKNPDVEPASETLSKLARDNNTVKVRRGVPQDVLETDIVNNWSLPENWTYASTAELLRIGAFIDLKDGNHGANHPKVADFSSVGLPFITAAQVKDFKIDYEGAYKISGEPLKKLRVGFSTAGDVIYTHKGSVGRVAIATQQCVLTPQTTYYRVFNKVIFNPYLMFYLASPFFTEQVDAVKSQTTRDFVPITEQYCLFHRIPPIEEQQEIVRRIETFFKTADQVKQQYKEAQAYLDQLDRSILAKAFRGELVPQDPNDEPASVLLERIRAEREKLDTKKKAKGKTEKKSRKAQPEAAEPEQLSLPGFD